MRDVLLEIASKNDDGCSTAVRMAALDRGTRRLLHSGDDYFETVARSAWGVVASTPVDAHGRPVASWRDSVAAHERVS